MKTDQIAEQAHEKFNRVQESVAHFAEQVKPMAQEAAQKSKDLYHDARVKMPKDSEKYAAVVLGGLAVAMIAYRMGKKKRKVDSVMDRAVEASSEIKKNLEPVANDYVTPAFKFVKLWMFYRLSQ